MQKTLWKLKIQQYKTFAVLESEKCEFILRFAFCHGKWVLPDPDIVSYRRPELVAEFSVDFFGVERVQEWYLLDFDIVCEAEGGQVKVPLFIKRYIVGGDKGFVIVHDSRIAFPVPLHTWDSFSLYSMDEGRFLIEEYIRKAVYSDTRDNIKDISPFSDDLPMPIDPEVRILFLDESFAKIYEEERKRAEKKK